MSGAETWKAAEGVGGQKERRDGGMNSTPKHRHGT